MESFNATSKGDPVKTITHLNFSYTGPAGDFIVRITEFTERAAGAPNRVVATTVDGDVMESKVGATLDDVALFADSATNLFAHRIATAYLEKINLEPCN